MSRVTRVARLGHGANVRRTSQVQSRHHHKLSHDHVVKSRGRRTSVPFVLLQSAFKNHEKKTIAPHRKQEAHPVNKSRMGRACSRGHCAGGVIKDGLHQSGAIITKVKVSTRPWVNW